MANINRPAGCRRQLAITNISTKEMVQPCLQPAACRLFGSGTVLVVVVVVVVIVIVLCGW